MQTARRSHANYSLSNATLDEKCSKHSVIALNFLHFKTLVGSANFLEIFHPPYFHSVTHLYNIWQDFPISYNSLDPLGEPIDDH